GDGIAIKAHKSAASSPNTFASYKVHHEYDETWAQKLRMSATSTINFPPKHTKLADWWIFVLVKVEVQERGHIWEADFTTHGTLRRRHSACGRPAKYQQAGIWHYITLDGVNLMGDEGKQAGIQAVLKPRKGE
ncbi:hypothetical protein MMC12_002410, partial [Toensbergia leucococca]|nr:hypothetical protein [Toensbergia leucococca]